MSSKLEEVQSVASGFTSSHALAVVAGAGLGGYFYKTIRPHIMVEAKKGPVAKKVATSSGAPIKIVKLGSSPIQIYVKNVINGHTLPPLFLNPSSFIGEVKQIIQEREGIHFVRQHLIFDSLEPIQYKFGKSQVANIVF